MKTPLTFIFLLLLILSCNRSENLTFEPNSFGGDSCPDCPEIAIYIPKAVETTKINTTINNALREEIIALLTFDDEVEATDINGAITSFNNGYKNLKKLYPDESIKWEAKIDARVSFEDKQMITLELTSYIFTGGAHGYRATQYLNFDKKKGSELRDWELFNDKIDFVHFAEAKFRIQEDIPKDKSINSTGFMFERDSFYLPENIGFTEKGIKLHYNQYEVASYADGPIELILPYSEVKKYLSRKIKS